MPTPHDIPIAAILAGGLFALFLMGTRPAGAADAIDPRQLENFVLQDCGSCHGMTLKGGLGSPLTPENLTLFSHDDLVSVILDGRPGTAMPPWRGIVSNAEADWIANFLKTEGPRP
ncbi:cytochrome c [Thalassospira sp.]|uniref:c-type cytochrome n=1 Tax=Thalassospira sp. TaxID=1912094 RepID=UPI0027365EFB|nr:cytochrome c [Thalassospira sp.]MDP2699816.1 cytochrome c [Thalassospira sp.]